MSTIDLETLLFRTVKGQKSPLENRIGQKAPLENRISLPPLLLSFCLTFSLPLNDCYHVNMFLFLSNKPWEEIITLTGVCG